MLATTCAVAWVAHALAGLPWPVAFALGAIVSPPDAVAATSILGRIKLPRRIVTVLEGESLVNDASGLVLYKFAVAAAVTGSFSLTDATTRFFALALGGIALGWVAARLLAIIHRPADDPLIDITMSFVVPYATYLAAEIAGVSSVLAVVTAGLVEGRRSVEAWPAQTRLAAVGAWGVLVFILNTLVFILIGLALPAVLAGLDGYSSQSLAIYAASASAVAILVRMLWVFPGAYLPRLLSRRIRETEPDPTWRGVVVVGWCGMRGIVSLAAALALPLVTTSGEAFPGRDLTLFIAFSVIIATLVLQGLTLSPLIRRLEIGGDWSALDEERRARDQTARAALNEIQRLAKNTAIPADLAEHVAAEYRLRRARAQPAHLVMTASDDPVLKLRRAALHAERAELIRLWREQSIGDDVLHHLERELDLEETRLSH